MTIATDKVRHLRYEPLRKMLSEVTYWPHRYCHKVIGKNGDAFVRSIQEFEERFPKMKKTHSGLSRKGNYLSLTYELKAENVDEIIMLWVASEELEDCVKIL